MVLAKNGWACLGFALVLCGAGCREETVELSLSRDGSGTVTHTYYMTAQAMDSLQLAKALDTKMSQVAPGASKLDLNGIDREALQREAAAMGEGVTLQSAEKVKDDNGREGQQAVFAFTDVNKLKLSPRPAVPKAAGIADKQPEDAAAAMQLTFKFTPGDQPVLLVDTPVKQAEAVASDALADPDADEAASVAKNAVADAGEDAGADAPLGMVKMLQMKQMFKGLKFKLTLAVDGTITETNASFVNKQKNTVTLVEMDFDQMLATEELSKLAKLGEIKDIAEAKKQLKDVKGVKLESQDKIKIAFE